MDRLLYLLPVLVCPGRDGPDDVADTARRPPRRVANRCYAGRRGARRAAPVASSDRHIGPGPGQDPRCRPPGDREK
jgi:hypothetical protein